MLVPPRPANDFSTGFVMAHIMPVPPDTRHRVTTDTIKVRLTKPT